MKKYGSIITKAKRKLFQRNRMLTKKWAKESTLDLAIS